MLGLASIMKTKLRATLLIITACLLVAIAALVFRHHRNITTDEQRFRQMLAAMDQKTGDAATDDDPLEALLRSGYLTKTAIIITNLPAASVSAKAIYREVQHRLTTHLHGVKFWLYYMDTNQAIVTCRSIDLPFVREAIESP
ncbi:MAG TPA: hypothetical protein DCQ92_09690 [Verrucomicrobia subdivision 3 bacterium]|nr:hypothetical protein [Limisphaerales bacterium]